MISPRWNRHVLATLIKATIHLAFRLLRLRFFVKFLYTFNYLRILYILVSMLENEHHSQGNYEVQENGQNHHGGTIQGGQRQSSSKLNRSVVKFYLELKVIFKRCVVSKRSRAANASDGRGRRIFVFFVLFLLCDMVGLEVQGRFVVSFVFRYDQFMFVTAFLYVTSIIYIQCFYHVSTFLLLYAFFFQSNYSGNENYQAHLNSVLSFIFQRSINDTDRYVFDGCHVFLWIVIIVTSTAIFPPPPFS